MRDSSSQTLILVDGSSFLFRAFHAVPPLTNAAGQPTNAIYGVSNMLRKLLNDYATPYFCVVFDAPGKTFRHEIFPDYKSHRPPMPPDLKVQIEPLHQLIKALGLPLIIEVGVEADDVLGSLAMQAAKQGMNVVISTGDKDFAQLVSERIVLENTMTNTRLDVAGVIDKFGVRPEQIIDYLALMGDAVDNVPGVPKVGPKTAAKWLQEYGTLENLMENSEKLSGKIGENFRECLQQLPVSKSLTTIRCDVALHYSLEDLKRKQADPELLKSQLGQLGFTSWMKTLNGEMPETNQRSANPSPEVVVTKTHYRALYTKVDFNEWLNQLKTSEQFVFDTETTSLDYLKAEIVGLSFCFNPGEAVYIPLAHDYPGVPEQLERAEVLEALKAIFENPAILKIGQNLKYDAHILASYDIALRGIAHDTMLESYVLDSTATRHNMDALANHYLGLKTIAYEDVTGKGVKQIGFEEVPVDVARDYACEDADITLRLHQMLFPRLQLSQALLNVYQKIELPLVSVLQRIESNGVLVDTLMLNQQSLELAGRILSIEHEAHQMAGRIFNLASPKQIQEVLFDKLQLPVLKKTPKGQPSTDESVLQELAVDYDLPRVLLEHRSISKLKSTYTDKLPQQVSEKTGRVHTSYHQAVAATGRLSSSDPNLQNIPIRTEEGRKIRKAFIAGPSKKILAADYSQIELRIMAHLSNDEGLIAAFEKGEDIHRATAAEVFGVESDQVTQELRRSAKAINFGLIYGMSAFGLAKQLGISRGQAQEYIDLYFSRYTGVKHYMDNIRESARSCGYVETLFGRRLYLPDIQAKNQSLRQYAERTAINAPMQGTAADIIKLAMLECDKWSNEVDFQPRMIMQVHDELVFEVPESHASQCVEAVRALMTNVVKMKVPLSVDIGLGNNWDQAH